MRSDYEQIQVAEGEGIVTVTLDRPERKNAATGTMFNELVSVFTEAGADTSVRAFVLTGAGADFCSGADLSAVGHIAGTPGDHSLVQMRVVSEAVLKLHRMPKPTIAKVRGVSVGAGMGLALACDLVVASETVRFSQIFSKRGLSMDGGSSWILPQLIGLHRAKELAFFGDIIGAEEAKAFGFVNRVVPDAELDGLVEEWARRLAAGPPLALSMTKAMLNDASGLTMEQALEAEARSQALNFATRDTAEAMAAFLEKRDPTFTGH